MDATQRDTRSDLRSFWDTFVAVCGYLFLADVVYHLIRWIAS